MTKDIYQPGQFDQSHTPKSPLLSRRGVLIGGATAAGTLALLGVGTFALQRLFPQELKIRDASSYFKDGEPYIYDKFLDSEKRHCEIVCVPVRAHQGLVLATGSLTPDENTTQFGIATAKPEIALAMTAKNNNFAGIKEFPEPGMPNQILTIRNEGDPALQGEGTAYLVYRLTGSATQDPQYMMTVCSSPDDINTARNRALGEYGRLTEIPLQLSWSGDSSEKVIPVYKEVVVLS